MGLLDGDIRELFGEVFGDLYLDGTLHRSTQTYATDGTLTETFEDVAIKYQEDRVTEAMRAAAGFSDTDVALIVLQAGIGAKPTADDEITTGGVRRQIAGVDSDPANSHWIIRGQRK